MNASAAEAPRRRLSADVAGRRGAADSAVVRAARRAAVVIALLAVAVAADRVSSGQAHAGVDAAVARGVVERTNASRAAAGLPPLSTSPQLTRAAEAYAREMARRSWFAHTGLDGASIETRAEAAGYANWEYLAENLATGAGAPAPAAVVSGWLASPDHRRNILSSDLRETGVACYAAEARYWCAQEFGARMH